LKTKGIRGERKNERRKSEKAVPVPNEGKGRGKKGKEMNDREIMGEGAKMKKRKRKKKVHDARSDKTTAIMRGEEKRRGARGKDSVKATCWRRAQGGKKKKKGKAGAKRENKRERKRGNKRERSYLCRHAL